jgi:hypothetical protein
MIVIRYKLYIASYWLIRGFIQDAYYHFYLQEPIESLIDECALFKGVGNIIRLSKLACLLAKSPMPPLVGIIQVGTRLLGRSCWKIALMINFETFAST